MTRLKGYPRHVRGWVDGIVEGAEPDAAEPQGTFPRGTLEQGTNLLATPTGRLAIRGGSRVVQTLHNAAAGNMQAVLGVWPYSQTGAVAIAHYLSAGVPETNLYRLDSALAFYGANEAASRHALPWPTNTTTVPRPVVVELFENLYVVDGQVDYAKRNVLLKVTSAGVVTAPTHMLDGATSAGIRGFCAAVYNGVLFVAGYDSAAGGEEEAMLRHSYLAKDPAAADGFHANAYAIIGSKGQRIMAMAAGRTVLLVAKANELYRISGTGRALDGWQYTVQQVENTQGFGCANPYALCFAEGYWYGVGEAGPFRTDGSVVESLVAARRETWRKVSNLRTAWVMYWPERRVVKFGFNQTPVDAGRSATYPFAVWNFDLDRENWTGDERYSADLHLAQAIPSLTASGQSEAPGPSAAPSGLAVTHASATLTSTAITWVTGDSRASTEIWTRTGTGGWVLHSVAPTPDVAATLTPLAAGTLYYVRLRHLRNGIVSDYTAETAMYTLLPAPVLTVGSNASGGLIICAVSVDTGTQMTLDEDSGSGYAPIVTFVDPRAATPRVHSTNREAAIPPWSYRARLSATTWPAVIQTSAYSNVVTF